MKSLKSMSLILYATLGCLLIFNIVLSSVILSKLPKTNTKETFELTTGAKDGLMYGLLIPGIIIIIFFLIVFGFSLFK